MALSVTIAVSNPGAETRLKAMLTSLGFDVGTTDAAASAALKDFLLRELRNRFQERNRETLIEQAQATALAQLETQAGLIA